MAAGCWALGELFALGLERFVGLRYLHRGRRAGGTRALLAVGLGLLAGGLASARLRAWAPPGLGDAGRGRRAGRAGSSRWSAFLLRLFSVFTTVSTMGVVLGVASLVVVLAVTSGFEREFQDKVLALNAHLIVQPYGDTERRRPRDPVHRGQAARHARAWSGWPVSCSRPAR